MIPPTGSTQHRTAMMSRSVAALRGASTSRTATDRSLRLVPPQAEHTPFQSYPSAMQANCRLRRGALADRRASGKRQIKGNWQRTARTQAETPLKKQAPPNRQRTLQPSEKRDYRPSAFLREDTRRRETGIFSSTPSSVRSKVPPDWGSTSLTSARLTR